MTVVTAALRRLVEERAGNVCEYCGISAKATFAAHEVDHVIAVKHGGLTEESNLALACLVCNQHKGSDIGSLDPESGALVPLFHPRRDSWTEHFEIMDLQILGRTPSGRATARLLQFNRSDRVRERAYLTRVGLWGPPVLAESPPRP